MKQKPFKRNVEEENNTTEEDTSVVKPFKTESQEELKISVDDIKIEDTIAESTSLLHTNVSFFNTIGGIITAIFIFVFFAVVADTVSTLAEIFSSGSIAEYIYLIGLVILLSVLVLNIISNIKQLRFIKNAEYIKEGFKKQKINSTKDIIPLTDTLLKHFDKNPDIELQNEISIIRDELNTSQIYKEIYDDIDNTLLPIIDKKAKQMIHNASVQAALSTAVSPLPMFDMVLIVWRSMLLTKNIALLYGFRPGRITTFMLLKQGILNVAFAGIAELATEVTNEIAGTSVLSKVSKSAGQGIANGVLLARLGYGVMEACRPIDSDEGRAGFVNSIIKSVIGSFGSAESNNKQ